MKIFLDTSFFVSFLRGEGRAKEIYEKIRSEELYTSLNVVEETTYILMKLKASELTGIEGHYDVIKELKKNENVYKERLTLSKEFFRVMLNRKIEILPATISWSDVLDMMEKYHLLPNDALIAAICKHHGIRKIATFDEDFKRVDFLDVIEMEENK